MRGIFRFVLVAGIGLAGVATAQAQSSPQTMPQTMPQTIGIETSLSGPGAFDGLPVLEGARLAVTEANQEAEQNGTQSGDAPIALLVRDDHSSPTIAAAAARDIAASDTVAVVGPVLTDSAMATGPIYAKAGLASITPTANGDAVPAAATTYQAVFNTDAIGTTLANYLLYALLQQCATVLYRDDAYGQPVVAGFKAAAERLHVTASYYPFTDAAGRATAEQTAADIAETDACYPAFVLAMAPGDAVPVIEALRRGGFTGPILGTGTIAADAFTRLFARTPEEQANPGFFTGDLYATAPLILDSADSPARAFARRFHAQFGETPSEAAMQSYDAMMLAIAAVRHARAGAGTAVQTRRKAVLDYLAALDSPADAYPGVTGPIWFTVGRVRQQPVRMGTFQDELFVSAPLQLVPVTKPESAQIVSGELRNIGGGYARIQQVAYTGMYVNEVQRVDISAASFTADFYLWLRYTPARDIGEQDPADIVFPDLINGSFNPQQPVLTRSLPDGSVYKLWQVRGQFKNDYDLHRYPFDQQRLVIRLYNATADSSRVVYVPDRQSFADIGGASSEAVETAGDGEPPEAEFTLQAAPNAFRPLTQWTPISVQQSRNNLVTFSGLGDPLLIGVERQRELSGFQLSIDVKRKVLSSLTKTLLPLALITLIVYSSLYFPPGLVKEKVTVAVTGALSGIVLQTSLNNQVGVVGYSMVVDYIYYVFFTLCLLCIITVLTAERYRATGKGRAATQTEISSRVLFALLTAATVIAVAASEGA